MNSTKPFLSNIQVQGQCQISHIQPLKIHYFRTFLIITVSLILVVPILIIFHYKRFRKYLFYLECRFGDADRLYVESKDGNFDIVEIQGKGKGESQGDGRREREFVYKQLRFRLEGSSYSPVVLDYKQSMKQINKTQYLKNGLSSEQVFQARKNYGQNTHKIKIPNYFTYVFNVLFRPLFLFQYIVATVFIIQGLMLFGIVLMAASIVTITGNYIVVYFNMRKIRVMAQKYGDMTVFRDGKLLQISSSEVVPGDLIYLAKGTKLVCDCLLLSGDIFVDESTLSGETIPIRKEIWREGGQNREAWLYDGSVVMEASQAVGYAVYTGFSSRKGRILRAILHRKHQNPDFLRSIYLYFAVSFTIALIFYFSTLPLRLSLKIDHLFVGSRILDYIIAAVPPDFIIYLTIAYSCTLFRLRRKGVISTMLEKTVEANRLKTACFDKTGTITEDFSKLAQIFYFQDGNILSVDKFGDLPMESIIRPLFGTCHAVINVNDQYAGDQIDVEMWKISNYSFKDDNFNQVVNEKGQYYKILVLNQFKSHFQSMSVLVKQQKTGNHYIFVKGAPQKLLQHSPKNPPQLSHILTQQSFKGRRLIGLGYLQLSPQQACQYLQKDRSEFFNGIQFIGIAAFENPVKKGAAEAIEVLRDCGIGTRIVSGDNIGITVFVGYRVGILGDGETIVMVEGKKFTDMGEGKVYDAVQIRKQGQQIYMKPLKISQKQLQVYTGILAVDNDIVSLPTYTPTPNTLIFSRILPDNKAKIIRLIKQQYSIEYNNKSFLQKLLENGCDKVAMVGDGSNDLISIQEADIGVAINGTDAVYSSAFAVQGLDGFLEVWMEGKCTTANCMEILRFLQISNFYGMVLELMMVKQATYLSQFQLIYINFLCAIPYACLISFAGPADTPSGKKVKDNFMAWKNHVTIWGALLIFVGALLGSYFILTRNLDYIPNPSQTWTTQNSYNPSCQLVTGLFYMYGLAVPSIAFIVHIGKPFKAPIFKNIPYFLLICCNFILITVFIFVGENPIEDTWRFVAILRKYTGVMFLCNVVGSGVAFGLVMVMHRWEYYWGKQTNQSGVGQGHRLQTIGNEGANEG